MKQSCHSHHKSPLILQISPQTQSPQTLFGWIKENICKPITHRESKGHEMVFKGDIGQYSKLVDVG